MFLLKSDKIFFKLCRRFVKSFCTFSYCEDYKLIFLLGYLRGLKKEHIEILNITKLQTQLWMKGKQQFTKANFQRKFERNFVFLTGCNVQVTAIVLHSEKENFSEIFLRLPKLFTRFFFSSNFKKISTKFC